jgi:hypothetical protein
MATLLTPTTELEAINVCLTNIGESPVSTIVGDISVDAAMARDLVRQVTREIQAMGFYWNTEVDYRLVPNTEGNLVLPANVLNVDTVGVDADKDLVARGRRMYDRRNHSYLFDKAVTVELVVALAFEELPESARRYISVKAARIFQERVMGSGSISNFNREDENEARAILIAENLAVEDNNMLTDSFTTGRILNRNIVI